MNNLGGTSKSHTKSVKTSDIVSNSDPNTPCSTSNGTSRRSCGLQSHIEMTLTLTPMLKVGGRTRTRIRSPTTKRISTMGMRRTTTMTVTTMKLGTCRVDGRTRKMMKGWMKTKDWSQRRSMSTETLVGSHHTPSCPHIKSQRLLTLPHVVGQSSQRQAEYLNIQTFTTRISSTPASNVRSHWSTMATKLRRRTRATRSGVRGGGLRSGQTRDRHYIQDHRKRRRSIPRKRQAHRKLHRLQFVILLTERGPLGPGVSFGPLPQPLGEALRASSRIPPSLWNNR
mmetsp:Transcript_58800/g.124699  ORF Transcript_58800/g.124699 Transcript_58800/m.124699 type:complete len:283 (+) Transcript_58800:1069-1917(+)